MGSSARDVVEARHAPNGVAGVIAVPPSKSLTQRALVVAALAGGGSAVVRPLDAEDPRLLYEALRAAGFRLAWADDAVTADGREPVAGACVQLGNNGTGARFLVALLAALPGAWVVDGDDRLRERPFAPLVDALRALGARVEPAPGSRGGLPLRIEGRALPGGEVSLDASASSQFVSALLLLGAHLERGIAVRLSGAPPSRPYIGLTAHVLASFGAPPEAAGDGTLWSVRGRLAPTRFEVEGDWSAAAFPMAAAAVAGGEVEVVGVRRGSPQGDAALLGLLAQAGCGVRASRGGVVVTGPARAPLVADLRDTPDLFPALAVVVAAAGGRLVGLGGLAAKESDRVAVMADRLARLGFAVEARTDEFASPGGIPAGPATGEPLDPARDHRIAMALAVAGCVVPGVRVADAACVGKSWPGFWSAWEGITAERA